MTTHLIGELQPRVDVHAASHHLQALHAGADGFISLVLLGTRGREQHGFMPVQDLWTRTEAEATAHDLQDLVDNRWNVYTACASFTTIPEHGRGTRGDVQSIPGVWADIDVKPGIEGIFQTSDEARSYVDRLYKPTILINSGSGGFHAYWLTWPAERPSGQAGTRLLERWRDYLLSEADGYGIDYVHDTTRVLRLAGTVRWPKEGENRLPAPVTFEWDDGPRYHLEELELISEAAHTEAEQLRSARTSRDKQWTSEHLSFIAMANIPLSLYATRVNGFNCEQDWAVLLERDGWTLHSDNRGNVGACRYWTRPGKSIADGKSASTDWTDHEGNVRNVMTIYSRDPALDDISETVTDGGQIICTKYQFALIRLFHGDESELLRSIVRGKGVLP